MKKRVLSLILAAVMACGLLPRLALAADVTVTEIVPPKYNTVTDEYGPQWTPTASEGFAAVNIGGDEYGQGGKWGFIDKTGKEVVPCKYDYVYPFSEGLAAVLVGDWDTGKWGFVDTTGKEVVPCKYDGVENFSEGLAVVELNYKSGFIDKTGKEVVPCKYSQVSYDGFSEGLAAVRDENYEWGYIDATGKEVVPCKYSRVEDFHEGLAVVELNYKSGVIDKTGKEVVPCSKYRWVRNFQDGIAEVATWDNSEKWGFIDATGKEVVPCKYDEAGQFSDGLAWVMVGDYDNDWKGYIDKTGKEVVPLGKYPYVSSFSEGLAAVELATDEKDKNGYPIYKWGFIDSTGREVIPCKYDGDFYAPIFRSGLAKVSLNGKDGLIDRNGKEVVPFGKYNQISDIADGFVAVQLDGKWGFLAIDGTTDTAATTAYASTQVVQVDGKPVTFNAYALKDANGNDTNYIKLRDVADVLSGSAAQFQVGWDGAISITTGQMYAPNGTENIQNFIGNQSYTVSTSPVTINGVTAHLEAITLTGADGGGYTYFKLRDLGAALGFNVTWSAETGITIDPNTPYNPNN